jgi:DNA repair protein RecN (Recombination protein N)
MGPGSVLKALTIQDLAIVRHLDLEFYTGLTVITGETGAGKSILVDALGLVLGDRADSSLVRAGAERAVVSACFDTTGVAGLPEFLTAHGLERDTECLLRRTIGTDGRSRAFCNESPVTLQVLKEIGAYLVDIHGQHEHHSLLQRATQRKLLDEYARLDAELAAVATAFETLQHATRELQTLQGDGSDPVARAEFLRFQIDELTGASIDTLDLAELEAEHRRQSHRQRLHAVCEDVNGKLFVGDRAALRLVTSGHHQIRDLESIDATVKPIIELFDQALINLVEAERELTRYRQSVASENTASLAEIERKVSQLHELGRKHRCDTAALPAVLARLQQELLTLESRDTKREELTAQAALARAEYEAAAAALTAKRRRHLGPMAQAITATLCHLGLPHADFSITMTAGSPSANGNDEIEFLVTTNPDQVARPLRKVVSGGELSRASLAVQVATASIVQVPTLVYDEVDTGIGGRIANVVAQHLRTIADSRQVLCVTHLAQVASAGARHLVITKRVADGATHTDAVYLSANERVEEIARMLGGAQPTPRSRAHARELLAE